jgi:hypothetical protein
MRKRGKSDVKKKKGGRKKENGKKLSKINAK